MCTLHPIHSGSAFLSPPSPLHPAGARLPQPDLGGGRVIGRASGGCGGGGRGVRVSPCRRIARNGISAALPLQRRRRLRGFFFPRKNFVHFSICACHPCAGAMLIFSVSFQFCRMIPEGNPSIWLAVAHVCVVKTWSVRSKSFNNRKGATCVLTIWCHMVLVLDEGPLVHRAPRPTLRATERSLCAMGVV